MLIVLLNYPDSKELPPNGFRIPSFPIKVRPMWKQMTVWAQTVRMEALDANVTAYVCTPFSMEELPSHSLTREADMVLTCEKFGAPFTVKEIQHEHLPGIISGLLDALSGEDNEQ